MDFLSMDFMHDELSALTRLNFSNFSDLIEYGVKIDGHPAGVHIFLYLWTSTFGLEPWMVRLPFILSSILSLLLIFGIARKLGQRIGALVIVALMASSQYFLTFGVMARPYSTGLLLILALFYLMLKLPQIRGVRRWYMVALMALLVAASFYNHYFSFLQVGLIFFFGFMKYPRIRKELLFVFISGGLLFVPHINITLFQFSKGGLDWLQSPTYMFHYDFLKYLNMYSEVLLLVSMVLFIISFLLRKNWVLFLVLFILPYLIIFCYSLWVKPIIQFSSLFFCTPFLLLFLCGGIDTIKHKGAYMLPILLLVLNIYFLFNSRKHYEIMGNQSFASVMDYQNDYLITNQDPSLLRFYRDKESDLSTFQENISPKEFELTLLDYSGNKIISESTPYKYREILERLFPYLERKEYGFTYDIYSYEKGEPQVDYKFLHKQIMDSLNLNSQEWILNKQYPLDSLLKSRYDWIQFVVNLERVKEQDDILPVIEIEKNGEKLTWVGNSSRDFYCSKGKTTVNTTAAIVDIFKTNADLSGAILKTYIWNRNKSNCLIKSSELRVREGNRRIYGLFQEF
jgi:hypothetical protein